MPALGALLYPVVAPAAAINLFLVGLLGPALGLPTLSPVAALAAGALAGLPFALLAGRWARRLLDAAR